MKRQENAKIARRNYQDIQTYLEHCLEVRQDKLRSVETYYYELAHLLRWSNSCLFPRSTELRPTFPAYLESLTHSRNYNQHVCVTCRNFFAWCRDNFDRYHAVRSDWVKSLRIRQDEDEVQELEIYTEDEVRELINVPTHSLIEQRDRAAVAMLFLSGMRNGAFCTLSISAVHLGYKGKPGMVKQWPKLGIRTKGNKAANTWLLNIPDFLEVVREWDEIVRARLKPNALWYPNFKPQLDEFEEIQEAGAHRSFNDRLNILCERAGMEYRSTHKLRHGHVVWALEGAITMADLKAISQNIMHSSLKITDEIYAKLCGDDVGERISSFGHD